MRKCADCNNEVIPDTAHGKKSVCEACLKKHRELNNKKHREAHPEWYKNYSKNYSKEYRINNKDRLKEQKREKAVKRYCKKCKRVEVTKQAQQYCYDCSREVKREKDRAYKQRMRDGK